MAVDSQARSNSSSALVIGGVVLAMAVGAVALMATRRDPEPTRTTTVIERPAPAPRSNTTIIERPAPAQPAPNVVVEAPDPSVQPGAVKSESSTRVQSGTSTSTTGGVTTSSSTTTTTTNR